MEPDIINWPILGDATDEAQNKITVDGNIAGAQDSDFALLRELKPKNKKTSSPSTSPSQNPSPSPTNVPSLHPSPSPTNMPSRIPSGSPSDCIDEPNWTFQSPSLRDGKDFSGMSSLNGKSCLDLESLVESNVVDAWCKSIAAEYSSGKCVLEACCFCGGGILIEEACSDNIDWNIGGNFGCKEIGEMTPSKASDFCDTMKEFEFDGLAAKDACCACKGGTHKKHQNDEGAAYAQRGRRAERVDGYDTINKYDYSYFYQTNLGQSPGIPNLEFLGIGYDIIRGNPRGSPESELDPGKMEMLYIQVQYQFPFIYFSILTSN